MKTLSFAVVGIAEKYRMADGSITLRRPGKIYLRIQTPVVASDVAQLTSDGAHFRIAVLKSTDEKYRRFVSGTNDAVYPKLDGSSNQAMTPVRRDKLNSDAQAVNALSNLRPQHLTDALLIRPIDPHATNANYAQSELFQSERDPARPESSKRVVHGYYLLEELKPTTASGPKELSAN